MAKKIEQVVPEIIDSVDGLNAKMNAMREAQKIFATYTQEQVDKIFFAAASATFLPTSVDPVKASFLKPLCSSIYWPDLEPEPVSTLNTPAGSTS